MSGPLTTKALAPGLDVSSIGLGCMGMSEYYGPTDDKESLAVLRRAVDLGVRLFDTADVYGPFSNEALVGRALVGAPDDVVLATKFGQVRTSAGDRVGTNGRPEYVRRSCDLSLQRLGVERIGLYYQHRSDPTVPIEDTVGAMSELVTAGKVAHIGLSEPSVDTLRRAHAVHPVSAVQTEYSLFSRDVEGEVLPVLRELGIGLVAYSPLGRGLLTGRLPAWEGLAEDDLRRRSDRQPRFSPEHLAANRRLVDRLSAVALDKNCTTAQLALAWLMVSSDVVPIPGTKHRERLDQNVAAGSVRLDIDDLQRIGEACPPQQVQGTRYGDMTTIGGVTVSRDDSV